MKNIVIVIILMVLNTTVHAQANFIPNYDESKVPQYQLPELLKTTGNKIVNEKNTWEKTRRPEIIKQFEDNVYGQMPKSYDQIKYSVVSMNNKAMDGKATLKEVVIEVSDNNKSVKINLVLFVPNRIGKKVPAFLLINNRPKENTDPTRAVKSEFWPAEMVIDSGYAIAAFHVSDLAPDNKDSFANGLLRLYPEQLSAANGMRAIGAWAWGASRVMDYLETDKQIDAKRVGIVGHSRGGKASLWAAAQDKRFALCVSNCSGNSGAAIARRKFGETIARINTSFPYWFTTNYKKYNDNEEALPVDQHMLLALIAPRPLYVTNATKDLWADPAGTFLSLKSAAPVYQLYGIRTNFPANPPMIDEAIIETQTGYHNHEGVHNMTAFDWNNFIKFANYHFKKQAK
ncbi:dienelactone hydrolase family protein [Flavitalea sp.]|nr:prolyl oligopeptidase family serine peptidase [Flavitalea sp.]